VRATGVVGAIDASVRHDLLPAHHPLIAHPRDHGVVRHVQCGLPELAKSWTLSDDKTTYTFHLQDNVKFHDGTAMTADDVIFSVTKFSRDFPPDRR
jgi:ABC-type oligopeptide transport system substrate-binding subunit